ncbi:MAG: amidase [Alphaproteobacteria bacterium]|nr:amidase [Alphaproteobacteria bacterium]
MSLIHLTAKEIAQSVSSGALSAKDILEAHIEHANKVNPSINAIVTPTYEEAELAAHAIDQAISAGLSVGPLAGVPVTVKVNVDQKGHATTNGITLQKDLIADVDSPVVSNLRRAGALIIGRTNTPAFSIRWFTRNQLHGATKNPRNHALTPGGSSGGGAAAAAAGIGAIAHGTDIAGSIRYPAYACGIHGLRPSLGRVAAHNFSGMDRHIGAQLMAVSGPMARSLDDVRLGFEALRQHDLRDAWNIDLPYRGRPYERRVALCTHPEGLSTDQRIVKELQLTADKLRDAGWVVEEVPLPPVREAVSLQLTLWLAEMLRHGGQTIAQENDPDANIVYQGLLRHAPTTDLNGFLDTLQRRAALTRTWRLFLQQYPLVLCPVSGALPFSDHEDVSSEPAFDAIMENQMLQIGLPLMGLPGMTVTTNLDNNIPVGVQLVASHHREDILFDAADIIATTQPIAGVSS